MSFKDFINERDEEMRSYLPPEPELKEPYDNVSRDYETEVHMSGNKMLSSRQPPYIHACLNIMEKYIFKSSKAEIIFQAVSDSWDQFVDDFPEEATERLKSEFREEFKSIYNDISEKGELK